jgi:hypothetical protein
MGVGKLKEDGMTGYQASCLNRTVLASAFRVSRPSLCPTPFSRKDTTMEMMKVDENDRKELQEEHDKMLEQFKVALKESKGKLNDTQLKIAEELIKLSDEAFKADYFHVFLLIVNFTRSLMYMREDQLYAVNEFMEMHLDGRMDALVDQILGGKVEKSKMN